MILTSTPFAINGNLGQAYNQAMNLLPNDEDWMFFIDGDVQFLTPDWGHILNYYVEKYPDTGMFTCWTNRIHPLGVHQLWNGDPSESFDIKHHIKLAKVIREENWGKFTNLEKVISGMLMGIRKGTWNNIKFPEYTHILGVDNLYSEYIFNAGLKIRRMDALYVFHAYRAFDITDKTHLL